MKAWSSDFSATPIPLMCCRLWFWRVFDETRRPYLQMIGHLSSSRQHPRSEQLEACPSIALSLQELELVHEALHTAVAPLLREPSPHRVEVLPQADGEALHRSGTRLFGVL